MKYAIIVLAACCLLAACVKNATNAQDQNCYTCYMTDSVYSNIPKLAAGASVDSNVVCDYTDGSIKNYQKNNTKIDTLYHKNDTLVIKNHLVSCKYLKP